jgi:cell division protein FtsL
MRRPRRSRSWVTPSLLVLAFSGFLSALVYVTWRQSRAFESLAELDAVARSFSLAEAEQAELIRRIQGLDNRTRISGVAEENLGMHRPAASEMVLLSRVAR